MIMENIEIDKTIGVPVCCGFAISISAHVVRVSGNVLYFLIKCVDLLIHAGEID